MHYQFEHKNFKKENRTDQIQFPIEKLRETINQKTNLSKNQEGYYNPT